MTTINTEFNQPYNPASLAEIDCCSLTAKATLLFQARTAATRPRRRVSSRASGRGRATTRWRTNSPRGAQGRRATSSNSSSISETGRHGSNDSSTNSISEASPPRPSGTTPAAVSSSNPDTTTRWCRPRPAVCVSSSPPATHLRSSYARLRFARRDAARRGKTKFAFPPPRAWSIASNETTCEHERFHRHRPRKDTFAL